MGNEKVAARAARGERSAQAGVLANLGLAVTKLLAGVVGNSYALVADAIEATADVFSSLIHIQADPRLSLAEAHRLSHQVKDRIQADLPQALGVLVHMEPHEG